MPRLAGLRHHRENVVGRATRERVRDCKSARISVDGDLPDLNVVRKLIDPLQLVGSDHPPLFAETGRKLVVPFDSAAIRSLRPRIDCLATV